MRWNYDMPNVSRCRSGKVVDLKHGLRGFIDQERCNLKHPFGVEMQLHVATCQTPLI